MTLAKQGTSPEDILVGGQVVIEGVMMRTPRAYAVAVRRTDGSLEVKKEPVRRISEYWKPLSLPVVRGFAVLVQSLALGIRTLNFSLNATMQDLEPQNERKLAAAKKKEGEFLPVFLSMTGAGAVAVFLFILAPLWITTWLTGYVAAVHNWVVFNIVDGLIRVVFFLAYILLISLMKDIRRVFQYHGAEHKVVYTWEAAEELTVENARRKTTLHPRCGTSFLLFVMVVPIPALIVGMIVSTASTLVLVRLLLDRGELHARHGRVAVGITLVDDLAVIRTMHTDAINHEPAILLMNTGNMVPGKPSIGAWLSYGLGSEVENLPAFVVMTPRWSAKRDAQALYQRLWGSGFLPSRHQGVALRAQGDPVLFLNNPSGVNTAARRAMLDGVAKLNDAAFERSGDPEIQ